jgi:hypothetical protein
MKLVAAANFCARRSRLSAYTAWLRGPCLRNAVPCPCLSAEPGALHRTVEFDDRITQRCDECAEFRFRSCRQIRDAASPHL